MNVTLSMLSGPAGVLPNSYRNDTRWLTYHNRGRGRCRGALGSSQASRVKPGDGAVPQLRQRTAARLVGCASAAGQTLLHQEASGAASPAQPQYDYFDHWWPISFVKDIDPDTPYSFTLLGMPLVIWKDPASGEWRAFKDVCPHRLVPLSEGRINSKGLLECGYHGWAFSGDGSCAVIPQDLTPVLLPHIQGAPCGSPRACATAYPTTVQQGLLFVKPVALPNPAKAKQQQQQQQQPHARLDHVAGSSGNGAGPSHSDAATSTQQQQQQLGQPGPEDVSDVPLVQQLDDPSWVTQDTWRDVPLDWSTVLENVLDASHVPFTHHKSISNRNVLGTYDIKLDGAVTEQGFAGHWLQGPRAGALGPQSTQFHPPSLMTHKIDFKNGKVESMVVVYAVPMGPGQCRLINRNLFKFVGSSLPGALMKLFPTFLNHIGTQVPLEDDQIFLHGGELEYAQQRARGLNPSQAYYMPDPADTYVLAFRQWIDKFGGGGPFGPMGTPEFLEAMGPRRDRAYLLDRYSQHTSKCASCQTALKRVDRAQQVLLAVQAVTAAAALLSLGTALAAAGGAAAVAGSSTAAAAVGGAGAAATGPAGGLSWLLTRFSSGLLLLSQLVVGGSNSGALDVSQAPDLQGLLLRAAAWGLVFAVTTGVRGSLGSLRERFFKGQYPPPRNTDKS